MDEAAVDHRLGRSAQGADVVGPASNEVLHRGAATAVRYVRDIDAERGIEEIAKEMAGRAGSGRGILERRLVRLGVGREFPEVFHWQILAREQDRRLLGHESDGCQVIGKIVERALVQRLIDGIGGAAENELVAVRRGLGDTRRPHHAAGAYHVLDDHLLAQHFRKPLADEASQQIGPTAGRERYDHRHWSRRPRLCGGIVIGGEHERRREHGGDKEPLQSPPSLRIGVARHVHLPPDDAIGMMQYGTCRRQGRGPAWRIAISLCEAILSYT